MQKYSTKYLILFFITGTLFLESCGEDDGINVTVPDFNFPTSITFEPNLSAYNLFQGDPINLNPANDYHLMELSAVLYTDYAKKQRLVKVPLGKQIIKNSDGTITFPDSTILAKTFYYYNDERDTSLGKRIIETRLLIKEATIWNIATYVWNKDQTDANLILTGLDTPVEWITDSGVNRSTLYHIPDENECIACHQANDNTIPLGTTLRNLNRNVTRSTLSLNQIEHLQSVGVLNNFSVNLVSQIVDYNDASVSVENRARAYMDLNCSHCHNPTAWEASADVDLDFSYKTSLNNTGILQEVDRIESLITQGEMPLIGTTILDEEGVNLIVQYLESL